MTDVIAGRFALCDPIARGGSGTVWRAYDRTAGQFCAAKVLRRRDAGDLLRFVREQSVRLTHPHIVTPYSWAAEDAHVVIASDLVDGGSLATLIGDYGPIAESTVTEILGQLLEALDYVHTAGFVHRDVKPANLLLSATGTGPIHVRLADFGIAMSGTDARLTQTGTVVGTPGYLAPEVLRGDVAPEPRHDLFAAGRVAAALAAGAEPDGLLTPADLSGLHPGPLRDLVAALTATSAADRPPSARAALDALRPVPSDPLPVTAGGDPIEVMHQLPPLSEEALLEVGAAPTQQLRVSGEPSRARRRSGQGRRVLLTVAGVAVAAAISVPVGFAVLEGAGRRVRAHRPAHSRPNRLCRQLHRRRARHPDRRPRRHPPRSAGMSRARTYRSARPAPSSTRATKSPRPAAGPPPASCARTAATCGS